MLKKVAFILAAAALMGTASSSQAMPDQQSANGSASIIFVANGCGGGGYRGPNGACHRYGYGPYPNGYHGPRNGWGRNGCPPGSWPGPWGHCRDTPYHGRLPGGGWK